MIDDCPDFSSCRVVVAGDVMLDTYVWGAVDRVSPEAPVPVVRVAEKTYALGGAGNVALNLAKIGCPVSLLGVRGYDGPGSTLARLLADNGIDDQVMVDECYVTTVKTRVMGQGQQLLRLDDELLRPVAGPTEEKLLADFEQALATAQVVILSDYQKGVFSGGLVEVFIARCAAASIPVLVDPKGPDWSRYARATCITPNISEFEQAAQFLSGKSTDNTAEQALALIQRLQLSYLLLTRGAAGMSLYDQTQAVVHVPTEARDVFDVSGAGDTVVAVAAAAFGCGLPMAAATDLANCAAGIVVQKVGTQPVSLLELQAARRFRQGAPEGLLSLAEARTMVELWRQQDQTVVFTNGCFDILHTGHVKLLHEAARTGDRLVVGLNADASVRRLKGADRPVLPETERAALLSALSGVDVVVLFEEDTPEALIAELRPDILVKGGDYTPETVVGRDIVEGYGGRVHLVPLKAGCSTSGIIDTVKQR